MKTIKFTAFLFDRYYSEGRWADNMPYFRTLLSMTLLGFIHLMQILAILHKVDLIPIKTSDNLWRKRVVMFLLMLPIFLLFKRVVKKNDLEILKKEYEYNWEKLFNANIWLIVYIILSFSFL